MTERDQVIIHRSDPAEALADVIEQIAKYTGPKSLEISYDRVGTPLRENEEPAPTDRIVWTCTAAYAKRGKVPAREISADHIVEPGQPQSGGGLRAALALLEKLGANVVLLDMNDTTDPRP